VEIIRRLKKVLELPVTKIALAVNRNKTTVYEALEKDWGSEKRGRKELLKKAQVNLLVRTTKSMIKNAAAKREITLAMILRRTRVKVSERCARQALQKRNIRFRRMREKPLLTKADVKDRLRFSQQYRHKTKSWWRSKVHLHIDLKSWKVYPNAKGRALAAQRTVRGAYRGPGDGLGEGYVVVPKTLKQNTGAKPARIAGGVGKGRCRLWHDVGDKWNGKVAAELYEGPVRASLRRAWPSKRKFLVLEDNDPTGFKSTAGEKAKKAAKINIFSIPKRSPDLSVMDYAVWKKIDTTMRRQEARWKSTKRETRAQYLTRLHRTAKNLPSTFVDKAIGNMRERCQRLYKARGHHFEEGGKSLFVQ
jgi:hypothetical protein